MSATIDIVVGDNKIWNLESFLLQLSVAMSNKQPIKINIKNEGPCAQSLGLYNILDQFSNEFDYDKTRITIGTSNLLETHREYNIEIEFPGVFNYMQEFANTNSPQEKKITKHFGYFPGRSTRLRLGLATHLYNNYQHKTLMSYFTDITKDYFRYHIGIEDQLRNGYGWDEAEKSVEFLKKCPMELDKITQFPAVWTNESKPITTVSDYYKHFFIDIIPITFFSGNTFCPDERIWRAIINKTPFITVGPANFLYNLKQLGFKTFDQWWDEGHSEDPPDYQLEEVKHLVDTIGNYSIDECSRLYNEMIPVLEHNREHFLSITGDILEQKLDFKYYEQIF